MFEKIKRLIAPQPPAAPAITPVAAAPVAVMPAPAPKARGVKQVTLAVPTTCDAEKKSIHFTLAYASRKAEQWEVTDGAIRFAFPHGASGYIVEEGNAANFTQPQQTCATLLPHGTKAVAVEARLGQFKLPYDCVSLFAFMCDTQGRVLAKTRIDIDDGFGADIVPVPTGATRMCFAWRLEGRGLMGDLSLTLERLGQKDLGAGTGNSRAKTAQAVHDSKVAVSHQRPGDDDAALTAPAAPAKDSQAESAAAEAANALLAERRFHAAVKMIEALEAQTDRDLKLLMRAYGGLHLFDKALEAHAKLSDKAKGEVSVLVNVLRAYANLGRIDDARDLVERRCHDLSPNKKTIEFLCMAYPFAVYISEPLADMVLARLCASPELVAKKNFNQLLRCAHDLAGTAKKYEFYKLSHALHNFELTSHDKAKLDILAAHYAWHNKRYDMMLESVNRAFGTYGAAPVVSAQPQNPDLFKHIHCPSVQAGRW